MSGSLWLKNKNVSGSLWLKNKNVSGSLWSKKILVRRNQKQNILFRYKIISIYIYYTYYVAWRRYYRYPNKNTVVSYLVGFVTVAAHAQQTVLKCYPVEFSI